MSIFSHVTNINPLLARPELQRYVVGARYAAEDGPGAWGRTGHKTLANVRDEYDAGFLEVCQQVAHTTVGERVYLLLAIPRRERADRRFHEKFCNVKLASSHTKKD